MTPYSWIRKLFARPPRTIRKAAARRRPAVEALECRLTPTYPAFTPLTGGANPFIGFDVGTLSAPALGNVDGDGDLDLVVGEQLGTLLYFRNTGSASNPVYVQQIGGANPFNGLDVGSLSIPALGDVDGDGDLDAVVGEQLGTLVYFRNAGTATSPFYVQQTGAANPFNGFDVGNFSAPALGDVDGDGDLDALVGEDGGTLVYFKNTGKATSPVFVQQTGAANPFNGFVTDDSTPALGDVDGDGDLDALVGAANGTLMYLKNTGTATSPVYAQQTGAANPFNSFDVGTFSAPVLGDVDGDGDRDALVGAYDGTLRYFRNDTVPLAVNYTQQTGAANPFNGFDVGGKSVPALGDVDGDGDLDALVGTDGGTLQYFRNTGTATNPVYVQQTGPYLPPTGAGNPWDGFDVGDLATPALGDVDGDGDLDLVVGQDTTFGGSSTFYFKNTGTVTSPVYVQQTGPYVPQTGAGNPFNFSFGSGQEAAPALGDVDGDGDLDLVVGHYFGTLQYFKNTGSATSPLYVQQTGPYVPQTGAGNPWDGIDLGFRTAPGFGDVDGDGDLDLVVGDSNVAQVFYFKNMGSATSPAYVQQTGAANPFNGVVPVGYRRSAPALGDVDGDGDLDALLGESLGGLYYYRGNRAPLLMNAIPDQTFSGPGLHSYAVPANTFFDIDNPLTYSATLVGGGALPAWLSFNPATRTFSGNPGPGAASPLQLRVTASDGNGGSIFDDFQLTLSNFIDNAHLAIVDNGNAGFSTTGAWQTYSGPEVFQGDLHFIPAGSGTNTATWSFTGLTAGASYRVSATWFGHPIAATNAPYQITGGATSPTVTVNQELAPVGLSDAGVSWQDLSASYTITGTTLTVTLSDLANDYVEADGIRIERIGYPTRIVDSGNGGFGTSGPDTWLTYSGPEVFGFDLHFIPAGAGFNTASWAVSGLPAGQYRVSATWFGHPLGATNAPFTVLDGATALATVPVNQELAPNDFNDAGAAWEDLGYFTISSGVLVVRLSDQANDYVLADAIRIQRVE